MQNKWSVQLDQPSKGGCYCIMYGDQVISRTPGNRTWDKYMAEYMVTTLEDAAKALNVAEAVS